MTLKQTLEDIKSKIEQCGDDLDTEETTKDVLIRPMMQALGYDLGDPREVKAEYRVKLRTGVKGRADYVIMQDGEPAVVIECKQLGVPLDGKVVNQMQQYAQAVGAFAGVATDGDWYVCYANAEDNGGSALQFLRQLKVSQLEDGDERVLEMYSKDQLSGEALKSEARSSISNIQQNDEHLEVLEAVGVTAQVVRLGLIEDADERNREVEAALNDVQAMIRQAVDRVAEGKIEYPKVITTDEELDAHILCKGMLHGVIEPERIAFRDSKTYASVLIDDNNRKPLCRFHFNGRIKYLGTFDSNKQETRHAIEEVDDLLKFARTFRKTAKQYAES